MKDVIRVSDMSRSNNDSLCTLDEPDLKPSRSSLGSVKEGPALTPLKPEVIQCCECGLDGTCALNIARPKSREEEDRLVASFLSGLEKLFTRENNWTFLRFLVYTMENCTRCQSCSDACHIYEASGRQEIYRPTYRTEVLRRLYFKYVKHGGLLSAWQHGDIELNWPLVARLAELSYRCNLCRRCTQVCPIGADNGLVAHELRKIFSQEMGIHPKELHDKGTMLQLKVGSTTGMPSAAVKDNVEFIDEDMSERTGLDVHTPWDVEGADVLLIHNAGEILAWPENPGAYSVVLNAAGIRWTLSSELAGYDAVNYGLWYDDAQFTRIALKQLDVARKLKVKKIVIGECGHAHKSLLVNVNRIAYGDLDIPRFSSIELLRDIVFSGKLKLDPSRNNFPVTLQDPCAIVRLMRIIEPQREILRAIAPRFREMTPHGVDNYCCGGGGGLAILNANNFGNWRSEVAGRKKLDQILNAFSDSLDPSIPKYVCAPCSNCKGQIRDLFAYWNIWDRNRILYGGLVELIVNAMTEVKPGFLDWEWR